MKGAQESNEPLSQDDGPHNVTAVSCGPLHAVQTRFVLFCTTRAIVATIVINKHLTDAPIFYMKVSIISAGEDCANRS